MAERAAQPSKKRSHNFSEEEKMVLLTFVQEHKAQLLGKAGRPGHGDDKVEERKKRHWQRCADAVNAVGGNHRSWTKVRKQWFSLKDKAKKLKGEMGRTGGGPKPHVPQSIHLCMGVMAREALDGIRGRNVESNPLGEAEDFSQESSQGMDIEELPSVTAPSTHLILPGLSTDQSSSPSLNSKVQQLQSQMESLASQPSALQRAGEIRSLKFQEEILKVEHAKVDLMRQTLDVQKKMLSVMESMETRALLKPMSEQ